MSAPDPARRPPIEFIFEFLFELLFELVAELLLTLGWESTSAKLHRRGSANAVLAAIGYVILGALVGSLSAWIFPYRLSHSDALSVLGLILNPLAAGFVLSWYGSLRRKQGKTTTNLATFVGGASFAFGVSLSRFLLIIVWNVFE